MQHQALRISAFDDICTRRVNCSIESYHVYRPMTYTASTHYALMAQSGLASVTLHQSHGTCSLAHTPTASGPRQTASHTLSAVSTGVTLAALRRYTGKSG